MWALPYHYVEYSDYSSRAFLLQDRDLVDIGMPLWPLSAVSRCVWFFVFNLFLDPWTHSHIGCMYRLGEACDPWRNMLEA